MRSTYSIQLPKPVPLTPPGFSNANSVRSKLPALARTYPHSARSQPTSLPSLPNGETRLGIAANGRGSGGGPHWPTEEAAALGLLRLRFRKPCLRGFICSQAKCVGPLPFPLSHTLQVRRLQHTTPLPHQVKVVDQQPEAASATL